MRRISGKLQQNEENLSGENRPDDRELEEADARKNRIDDLSGIGISAYIHVCPVEIIEEPIPRAMLDLLERIGKPEEGGSN
jgi:hypothetical protein